MSREKKHTEMCEYLRAWQQSNKQMRLLEKFQCIFSDMPGTSHLAVHKIEMTIKSPICVRPYPIPYAKRQEVEKFRLC